MLILIGVGGIAGLLALNSFVTNAIFPGASLVRRSTSMKPYDIYFRNYFGLASEKPSKPPGEWHLRVPEAIIIGGGGTNGSIADESSQWSEYNTYRVNLFIDVDPISGEIEPVTGKERPDRERFLFQMQNVVRGPEADGRRLCETSDRQSIPMFRENYRRRCGKDVQDCKIWITYRGWYFFFDNRAAFLGDEAVRQSKCDQAISILTKMTIKVDDMNLR